MSNLYTDDHVQLGEDALFAAWGLPEKLARRGARMDTQTVLDAVLPAYRARLLSEVFTRLTRSLSYEVGEQGMRDAIAIVKTMYDEETP